MLLTQEKELVHRTLNGDQDAFGSLYHRHRARIYATVRGRTRNPEDVDDLVQNTFVRAYLGLPGFRGEAAFSTWLTQIAINLCTSHSRSEKALAARLDAVAKPDLSEAWQPAGSENPEDVLYKKQHKRLLRKRIEQLPAPYRDAIRLRYLEDRSYREITRALQVPMGTVKSWLYRARRELEAGIQEPDLA